jgi:CheY-like chemotaxis protein
MGAADLPFPGLRVLVVEDEPLIAIDLETTLADLGCLVVATASDAAAALELARTSAIDIALVDLTLQGKLALDTVYALLERGIRVILATAMSDELLPAAFVALTVVRKPFSPDDIAAGLRAALR